ncbi:Ubiquitin [Oryctes borbonicus]|uniref:Ubiquitin n=1 Tax=Oryctes borbonicus TaxID=1629725 RepID=A0A0T6B7F7_9SCAR|nr:Ubiquitin [Oryctes borbonicus]
MRQFLPEIGISNIVTSQNHGLDPVQDLEDLDDFYDADNEVDVDTEQSNETDDGDDQPPPEEHTTTITSRQAELHQRQAEARLLIASIPEENFTYVTEDTAFVTKNYLGIDPATGLIEVFVHLNKKEIFILQRTATVESLKQMIAERKGIPVDIQRLVFAGKVLQNNTTLQENRIMCGSSIHLFIRLRGGCRNNCNYEIVETDATNIKVENYM